MKLARAAAGPSSRVLLAPTLTVSVVAGLTLVVVRPVSDLSPWLHLRVGQFLVDGGRFGSPDPFSSNAVGAYVPTQWLPSVVTYELYAVAGPPAIAWLRALSVLVLFLIVLVTARRHLPTAGAVVVSAVVTIVSLPTMTERPQSAGMVLLAVSVLGWWRSLEDGRARWWLVPLAWLFACTHGLWSIALGVGVAVCLGRLLDGAPRREVARLVLVLLGQVAATALTPLGPGLLLTPLTVGANGREFVTEWQPGNVGSVTVAAVLLMLGLVVASSLRAGRPLPWSRLLLLAAVVALAFAAMRTAAPAALLAVPLLCESLGRPQGPERARRAWGLASLFGVVALGAAMAVPLSLARAGAPLGVPSRLAGQLSSMTPGTEILAQADITGWVLWSAPNLSPVVDIRNESYTPSQLRRYVSTYQARPGWQDVFTDRTVNVALVQESSALSGALVDTRHWRVLGRDAGYVLLGAPS